LFSSLLDASFNCFPFGSIERSRAELARNASSYSSSAVTYVVLSIRIEFPKIVPQNGAMKARSNLFVLHFCVQVSATRSAKVDALAAGLK
jgi:hypothetical protein